MAETQFKMDINIVPQLTPKNGLIFDFSQIELLQKSAQLLKSKSQIQLPQWNNGDSKISLLKKNMREKCRNIDLKENQNQNVTQQNDDKKPLFLQYPIKTFEIQGSMQQNQPNNILDLMADNKFNLDISPINQMNVKNSKQIQPSKVNKLSQNFDKQQLIKKLIMHDKKIEHFSNVCVHHQNKKAKYQIQNYDGIYCSKCAVKLASEGYNLIELESDQENSLGSDQQEDKLEDDKNKIKMDIQKLLSQIDVIQSYQQIVLQDFQTKRQNIQGFYSSQLKKVDSYFEKIQIKFQQMKNNCIEKFQRNMQMIETKYQQQEEVLLTQQHDIQKIKEDVYNNQSHIIKDIVYPHFKTIINNYQKKLSQTESFLKEIKEAQIHLIKGIEILNSPRDEEFFQFQEIATTFVKDNRQKSFSNESTNISTEQKKKEYNFSNTRKNSIKDFENFFNFIQQKAKNEQHQEQTANNYQRNLFISPKK